MDKSFPQSLSEGWKDKPKVLLEIDGKTLVRHVVENALASSVSEVIVVVGNEAERIRSEIAGYAIRVVENARYAEGQSTSVIAGMRSIGTEAEAVIVMMADQPFVTPAVIDALIARYHEGDCPIVAPEYDGQLGAPVLFDHTLFNELLEVSGDKGGRDIIRAHRASVCPVKMDPAAARDIDTWQEYLEAKGNRE